MPKPLLKTTAAPGWFGKIPNLGDFASRRLPEGFVRRWDRWLQSGLAQSRGDLGEAWLDAYLVAPILRFWLAPGTLGPGAWAGLLMPSVDRVGRHFPLTLAQPCESLAAALAAREWFAALDAAARQVLDMAFTLDDLEAQLLALPALESSAADAPSQQLAETLRERCATQKACSLWWCADAHDEGEFLIYPGLPPAEEYASMLGATA